MPTRTAIVLTIVGRQLPGRTFGPCADVQVALQVGKEHVGAVFGDAPEASWTSEIAIITDDPKGTDIRGSAVHGRRGERFLYLAWLEKTPNGEHVMFRRAKLQFDGVPAEVVTASLKSRALRAELILTACDGSPLCASVRPPAIRWSA